MFQVWHSVNYAVGTILNFLTKVYAQYLLLLRHKSRAKLIMLQNVYHSCLQAFR